MTAINDMKKATLYIFVFLAWLAASAVSAAGQTDEHGRWINGIDEPWCFTNARYTDVEAALAQARWGTIEADLASSAGDEWAGNYKIGGEMSLTAFRWSPQNGFVIFNVHTCMPEVRDLDYGTVTVFPNYLLLASHRASQSKAPPMKYLKVKWGERRYLIPEEDAPAFYNFIAGYGGGSDDLERVSYLLRSGDHEKPVEGMPAFPPGYEHIERRPIDAMVVAVGPRTIKRLRMDDGSYDYESRTTVTINAGSASGVKRGMVFNVLASRHYETVKITRVNKQSSSGIIVRSLDDNKEETGTDWNRNESTTVPRIGIGWLLSTRPRDL